MIRTATSLSWRNLAAKSDLTSLNLFSRSIVSSSALGPRVFSAPLSRGFSRTQCTQTLHACAQVSPINFGRFWWSRANVHPIETTFHRSVADSFLSLAVWLIKRTYQPSLLKKKRQCGYMKRQQSVGGRRILKRRRQKGRKRLFGA